MTTEVIDLPADAEIAMSDAFLRQHEIGRAHV